MHLASADTKQGRAQIDSDARFNRLYHTGRVYSYGRYLDVCRALAVVPAAFVVTSSAQGAQHTLKADALFLSMQATHAPQERDKNGRTHAPVVKLTFVPRIKRSRGGEVAP